MKEVKFLVFSLLYLLIAFIMGIIALVLKWIPFLEEKMEEVLNRITFIWKVILNHYGKLSEKQQFSEVNFTGKLKSMKNGVRVSIDTDDVGLLLILLYDALYIAWGIYGIVSLMVFSIIYPTMQSNVESVSQEPKQSPAYTQQYEPTPAKKQQFEVCPCINEWDGNNGKLALLDPKNGEIVFSKVIESSSEDFVARKNSEVTVLEQMENDVKVKIGNYDFTVFVNQSFQIKGSPFFVYLVDSDGKINAKKTEEN